MRGSDGWGDIVRTILFTTAHVSEYYKSDHFVRNDRMMVAAVLAHCAHLFWGVSGSYNMIASHIKIESMLQ